MKGLEKPRLNDNLVGGMYGQTQRQRFQAHVYEEYKTYGRFHEEIEEEFPLGGGRHQQLTLGPSYNGKKEDYGFKHGFGYKGKEEEEKYGFKHGFGYKGKREEEAEAEDEELYRNPKLNLMQSRASRLPPLKCEARISDDDDEEEDDYRVRLRQYRKEHEGDKVRHQPHLQYKPHAVHGEEEKDYRYRSSQLHNHGRSSNFKLTPPMTPPKKNNKVVSDGWHGRQEETHKFVDPEILTRLVFIKPSPGGPEMKWKETAAAMGSWRVQHGGYMEAKWARNGT
ncbi:PREDICTED: uncharacterized protein LOC104825561 [Tarenaya hassleriana]|uniref:uncharacterized protein LOC104825561 n=1 Tax=Tarenaya hassleriana TaxID=28532 RepID=UPI00053C8161|nr:PREDICTED: uncharacterized protein LOC104825561 [Tarenaya hassleriana]